jgi:hypothetical protein
MFILTKLFSSTTSARSYECAQLFVTNQDFAEVYPMQSKSDVPYKLDIFCKTLAFQRRLLLITHLRKHWVNGVKSSSDICCRREQGNQKPESGWQNRSELDIRELKKHFRRVMHRSRCPEAFWCYGIEYTKEIRKLMARTNYEWRTPVEILTGDTPD